MKHISIRVALFLSILLVGSTFPMAVSAGEYESTVDSFQYGDYLIPAYDGAPSENVNEGMPAFSEEELFKEPFVEYGELDPLGRCTVCYGDLNQSLMPTWKRGSISQVKPTGWVQKQAIVC